MAIISINPSTEEVLKSFSAISDNEVVEKINSAEEAFQSWKMLSFEERGAHLKNVALLLKQDKYDLGKLITLEMGKPIKSAIAEVEKCAWVFEYYAENAKDMMEHELVETNASESYVQFDPLGVILAVMPWNFPFWQVMRFAAPALMAGNVALLKHASNVPQSAIIIEEVFIKAGLPKNVFQTLMIGSSQVEKVVRNPLVKAVTLTGSEYAGSQVASQAAQEIKKSVLELGGSDPFIVLADADIDNAVSVGVTARLQNCGQSCIAGKRFILHESIADEFTMKLRDQFEMQKIGNPLESDVTLGPLATKSILEEVETQVIKSVELGAKIYTGGKRVEGNGYFYEPTILTDLKKGMPAYDEELFGPVASIIVVSSDEEAIQVANDTPFGLGSSIWTSDIEHAKKLACQIEAGNVFINGMVTSDPRLPFGGAKRSGFGRELSHYGLREFVNVKTVWIK